MLSEEPGSHVTHPPTTISTCVNCLKVKPQPVEGETFAPKKRKSRGKFVSAGSLPNGRSQGDDNETEMNVAQIDQALTVAVYGNNRRQASLFGQEMKDREQASIRSYSGDRNSLDDADKILDGKSLSEIQELWGINSYIARSRGFDTSRGELLEMLVTPGPKLEIRPPAKCSHGCLIGLSCSVCKNSRIA
jgi:hypothetical protein